MGHAAETKMDALEDVQSLCGKVRAIRGHSRLRNRRVGSQIRRTKTLLKSMGTLELAKRFRFGANAKQRREGCTGGLQGRSPHRRAELFCNRRLFVSDVPCVVGTR